MRTAPASILACLVLFAGCDGSSPAAPSASTSPSAASAPATAAPTAVDPPGPPPEDFDVAAAQKALKCANDAKSGLCSVLARMKSCGPWSAAVPSGDGRWLGRATVIEAGKSRDTFVILRSHRVAATEVAPGQLGVKIALVEIPKDEPAFAQADKALRAFERGDVPQHGNSAIDYVKTRTDWPESYAMSTKSGEVEVLSSDVAFVCLGPKQELLLAQRGAKASADGLYAELRATSW